MCASFDELWASVMGCFVILPLIRSWCALRTYTKLPAWRSQGTFPENFVLGEPSTQLQQTARILALHSAAAVPSLECCFNKLENRSRTACFQLRHLFQHLLTPSAAASRATRCTLFRSLTASKTVQDLLMISGVVVLGEVMRLEAYSMCPPGFLPGGFGRSARKGSRFPLAKLASCAHLV